MSDESKKDLTEQVEDSKISFRELSKKGSSSPVDKITTLVLLIICVGLFLYVLLGKPEGKTPVSVSSADAETVINVQTMVAKPHLFQVYTRLNGEISSDSTDVSVLPDTSGTVSSVLVRRGEHVTKDQVIAYVDPSRPGQNYKESPVTSPVDGIVTAVPVSVGETVSASTAVAAVSPDGKKLHIDSSLPERYIGTVGSGMDAYFSSVAYPGEVFTAEISYISPTVKTSNRTADIELEITSGEEVLRDGMYVSIDLVTEEINDALTVPTGAVTHIQDEAIVYVVEDGKAMRRSVTLGSDNGSEVVVTSGLEAGETVVTAGTVADGSSVNVVL